MAKDKKTTPANTGLHISRNKNKFTAKWKIKADEVDLQEFRYRTYNGKKWGNWHEKTLGNKTTSTSFTLDNSKKIRQIQVQTRVRRKDTDKTNYVASDWSSSSAKWKTGKPPTPSLSVTNNSANSTTFSWSITTSDTNAHWYRRCMYRTKCGGKWSKWAAASSSSYTYNDPTLGTTRLFQIKAVGPGGQSEVKQRQHNITTSPVATWGSPPVSVTEKSSYYNMTYNINLNGSKNVVDNITPQYYIGLPTASMGCPGGASWTDGTTYNYSNGKKKYSLAITTSDTIEEDECLWARVKTAHDSVDSYSEAYRVITGVLKSPVATITVGTPTPAGFSVDISITDAGTDVPGTYVEVYLEKNSATGLENYIRIGTMANGTSTATINSSEDITGEDGYSIHIRNVTADGSSMVSDYNSYATTMPTAPTLDDVSPTTTTGKVYLTWTNTWADATGIVIAWTDDPDNWMSNDDPEEYEIHEVASSWFIVGLDAGKKWYFRVRSMREDGDNVNYSPWSADSWIDLAEAPAVPTLYLSEETITEDGMVTAYWSYVSTDGTAQVSGNVVEATYSGGVWTFGDSVGATTSAQHIDIYAEDWGWTNGSTVYLALQTRSGSGGESEYSTPVALNIAAKPTVAITSTDFNTTETVTEVFAGDGVTDAFLCANDIVSTPSVTVDEVPATVMDYTDGLVTLSDVPDDGAEVVITYDTEDTPVMEAVPFDIEVTSDEAATLSVVIERAVTYPMLRPDGVLTEGAVGETVFVETQPADYGSTTITIENQELIGRLDDGAFYNLIVTVSDEFGQTASEQIYFKVHWTHQAWAPTATFVTDPTTYIARITPVAGADYVSGDTCDIYRLGADLPELIYSGADFGTEYVDPYPAFGALSGYKVVTVTENNDYITEEDKFAEFDTTVDENNSAYTHVDPGTLVIDFDGKRIELEYNITLSNSWSKDFQRTSYLGGHVTGDHNKAVLRDLSASSVTVKGEDPALAQAIRELADYPGTCHVRTPEGSSFAADVQVSEGQSYNTPIVDTTLTIQRVDTVGFDGMTYKEWSETQA